MELAANTIHIWLTRMSSIPTSAFAEYYNVLSQAELARNRGFSSETLRNTDAITRTLLRTVLSQYENYAPLQWEFDEHDRGKPYITHPSTRLCFNLSHSSEWVVCAIAQFPVIGVDIEHCLRNVDVLRLARRFFSSPEYEDLLSLCGEAQKSRFFDYWTLKESYIKARGEGVSLGLDKFSFKLSDCGAIGIACDSVLEDDAAAWHFRLSAGEGDHRLALAVKPPQPTQALEVCHYFTIPLRSIERYTGPLRLQEPVSPKTTIQQSRLW